MKNMLAIIALLICAGALAAGPASAVGMRFAPADTTVNLGTNGRLSIMLDEADTVRTIEVFVTYDTTVVASVGGGAGELYAGFLTFQGIDYPAPDQWHGFAVIMGADKYISDAGELYYWDFQGIAGGVSPIVAVEVYLVAGNGSTYDTQLDSTTITVFDPSGVDNPLPVRSSDLNIWPNPFNPRTTLSFELDHPTPGRVAVYDLRGQRVTVLHEGLLPAGYSSFDWDGRDRSGRLQAAGQYLFRLETGNQVRSRRATLIK